MADSWREAYGEESVNGLEDKELTELMEYSAKFDIRPRRRFLVTSGLLGLFTFILSCVAEEEKYSKSEHLAFCNGDKKSSSAGIFGVVAMALLIAAYVSCISGTNECCNMVVCLRIGGRKFNAGIYLCLAHFFFIVSIIMLYFASMRELNSDCPTNMVSDAEFKILKDGYFASGGVLGFIAVVFSMLYYLDSLTLAGIKGEQGLLNVKKKTLGGTITSKAVALNKTTAGESGETEMVSINVDN
ncbi:hypothetical protein HOP50_04g31400 [Chloropicon primus]|uniref:Transmembrane protein n=1 Tax=Chloropicon primus TaxID=1764295 RepID=A0A5B8MMT6_9CHLO|nr:hypothetical protein A3770_04p31380 [Chloropicon primus]UPQ99831.1 hypothetical protein HOP50_04g31400 [Chloropicon primus]|eukprot:QDZ20620.1 hypothetical protein A3770_04p31380 [Chloropicon primus]